MKKHFPPHLSQMVFVNLEGNLERITALDYDLFLYLIYKTDKEYSETDKECMELEYSENDTTYIELEYSKISESINSKPNTDSIKKSLEKIGSLQLLSNYLNSYENKEKIVFKQPFKIELIQSMNGKSYGCAINTSKRFLNIFDNPIPKVEVDYTIIYNLNKMSKPLYLFLKDSLGIYQTKNRKVKIEDLMDMVNINRECTSKPNFLTQLKKSVKDINAKSNIKVDYIVEKVRNIKLGTFENISVKFTIKENKMKVIPNNSISENNIPSDNTATVAVNNDFEEYLEELVEKSFQDTKSKGIKINTTDEKYKSGIRKKLLENEELLRAELNLIQYIEQEKSLFREEIKGIDPYMLIFTDENPYHVLYINNDYKLVNMFENKIITESIFETKEYIKKNEYSEENQTGTFYFDIIGCGFERQYDFVRI